MYILSVETRFSAAHLLRDFPGKCAEIHGHTWKVRVNVACKKLSETGIAIDFEELCKAVGVKKVTVVNPHDIDETRAALREHLEIPETTVLITRAPCVLLPEEVRRKKPLYFTNTDNCTGCMACVKLGCPAISWNPITPEEAVERGYREKQKGYARITEVQCNGCGQCSCVCKFEAITLKEEE